MAAEKRKTGKTGTRVGDRYVVSGPFDVHLEALAFSAFPERYKQAAVVVNDTLDMAWCSVRQVFGDYATPDHALALLPILLERCAGGPTATTIGEDDDDG